MAQASPVDLHKLLQDIVEQLGKEERIEFRDFLWELKAKRDAGEIPSLTDAVYYRSEFIVGPEIWRRALELQLHSKNLAVPDGSGLAPTFESILAAEITKDHEVALAAPDRSIQSQNEKLTERNGKFQKAMVDQMVECWKHNDDMPPQNMVQSFVRGLCYLQGLGEEQMAHNEQTVEGTKAIQVAMNQELIAVLASEASLEETKAACERICSETRTSVKKWYELADASMLKKREEIQEYFLRSKGEDDSAGEAKDAIIAAQDAIIAALRAELVRRDTVEVFDVDSGETTEAPAPKRQRTDATSGIAVLAENAEAAKSLLVRVKDEKQRAEGEKEDAQDLLSPLNKTINALQTKVDELAAFAKAGGLDPHAIDAIKYRSNV